MNMKVRALADRIWDMVPGAGKRYYMDLVSCGREGIVELAGMLKEANDDDTVNASFALEALTQYCMREGADAERQMVASALAEALETACGDDVARAVVIKCLQLCGGEEQLPAVARWLDTPKVRDYAIMALTVWNTPATRQALVKAAEASSPEVALEYVSAFAALREKAAAPVLMTLLTTADSRYRVAVMNALAEIGEASAADAFLAALKADTETERAGARGAIAKLARNMSDRGAAVALAERYDAAEPSEASLAVLLDVKGIDGVFARLMQELDTGDFVRRNAVFNLLATHPSDGVVPGLMAHFDDAPAVVQAGILGVLGKRGDGRAREFVTGKMASDDQQVRAAAYGALPAFGTRDAVRILVERLLGDVCEAEAAALKSVLVWQQDDMLVSLVAKALSSGKAVSFGKIALIELLAERGAVVHSQLVFDGLSDSDGAVRLAAMKALNVLAVPADAGRVLDALASADGDVLAAAQDVLVTLGGKDGGVVAAINDAAVLANGDTCGALLDALARIGGKKALEGVAACYENGDGAEKTAAVKALAAWPDTAAEALLWQAVALAEYRDTALAGLTRISALTADATVGECVAKMLKVRELCNTAEEKKALLTAIVDLRCDDALTTLVQPALADAELAADACAAAVKIACSRGGKDAGMNSPAARDTLEAVVAACQDETLRGQAQKQLEAISTEEGAAALKLQAAYAF